MASVPGSQIVTKLLGTVLVVVILLVLFGPPGMAGDFLTWLGGKISTFLGDLLSRLPESETTALGGTR